jgi:hypothetical protein
VLGKTEHQGKSRGIMQGVPKVVRRRLQVANEASAEMNPFHPDATLLAAFAEQSLARRERSAVFDHLARCADCRDVVFLSAPQINAAQTLSKISAQPGGLRLPILRWGVLGACALVVVAVTLRYEGEKSPALSPREVAGPTIPNEIASAVPEEQTDIRSQLKTAEPRRAQHKTSEPYASRLQASRSRANEPPASPIVPERHAARAVPKFPMQFDGPLSAVQKLPPAERAPPSAVAALQSRSNARLAKNGNQALDNQARDEGAKKAEQKAGLDDANLRELSEAQSTVSPVEVPTVAGPLNATDRSVSHLTTLISSPRWMLTSSGALQRSLDEGRSWELVAHGLNFRALSVQGAEIWVGGAAGALYHSADLGQNWAQIIPNSNGEALKAEITRIEFASPQEGVLTTAAGETWITSDSGRTWLKK